MFDHELAYSGVQLPDAGFQILSVFRFWNIIRYWFPYRDVLGEDWDQVLTEFIPRIALKKNADGYQRELMALIAKAHDTHANLWSSLQVRPPTGACQLPVSLRFIKDQGEERAVVTGYTNDAGKTTGLKAGDVITGIDGVAVPKLVAGWAPYYAASNEPTLLRDIAGTMTRGACTETTLSVQREKEVLELKANRIPLAGAAMGMKHDLPGETFRLLSKEVAYLKLSSVKAAEAAHYIEAAAGTKGLVLDIRNYPSQFMVFALGSHLVGQETEFARFTTRDVSNPGAFLWTRPLSIKPENPRYSGKIVILVDEVSQSQAEYTSMAFRASPNSLVLGSTTAGADGCVCNPAARRSSVDD